MTLLKMSLLGKYEPYNLVICYFVSEGLLASVFKVVKEVYPFLTAACTPYTKGAQIPGDKILYVSP